MGMPIDQITQRQAIEHVLEMLARGRGGWVITPNLDQLRFYHRWPDLRQMYERAELVLADGMPLLWAGWLQGTPLPERVAGSELIYTLTASAAEVGRSVFFLGGNPCAANGAALELRRINPLVKIAGTYCPPLGFEKDQAEMKRVIDALNSAAPNIVFVGLGFPKQEKLIESLRDAFQHTWFLGVGISFSFVSGEIRRAPRWLQRLGLEWVHRMSQEPRRLFVRYVVNDLPFAVKLFAAAVWKRVRRK
jgi:N-acetylglucosaminyldiphosphoundecaprenol N-acetyl-beta-D-mannosaminyltransferase